MRRRKQDDLTLAHSSDSKKSSFASWTTGPVWQGGSCKVLRETCIIEKDRIWVIGFRRLSAGEDEMWRLIRGLESLRVWTIAPCFLHAWHVASSPSPRQSSRLLKRNRPKKKSSIHNEFWDYVCSDIGAGHRYHVQVTSTPCPTYWLLHL